MDIQQIIPSETPHPTHQELRAIARMSLIAPLMMVRVRRWEAFGRPMIDSDQRIGYRIRGRSMGAKEPFTRALQKEALRVESVLEAETPLSHKMRAWGQDLAEVNCAVGHIGLTVSGKPYAVFAGDGAMAASAEDDAIIIRDGARTLVEMAVAVCNQIPGDHGAMSLESLLRRGDAADLAWRRDMGLYGRVLAAIMGIDLYEATLESDQPVGTKPHAPFQCATSSVSGLKACMDELNAKVVWPLNEDLSLVFEGL